MNRNARKIEELQKQLYEIENVTIEKEVLGVIDKKGRQKYITCSLGLSPKIEKALLTTNENGIRRQKQLVEDGYKISNVIRVQKKPYSYSKHKEIHDLLIAYISGFETVEKYEEYKKHQKEKYITERKAVFEESYFYKNRRKDIEPYSWFFDYEYRDSSLYNYQLFIEVIKRKAAQFMNIEEVYHSAKNGSKFKNSIYLKNKETGIEVRISNHELPDINYRGYMHETYGTRWNKELIIDKWKMDELVEIKTEREFKNFLCELFDKYDEEED